MKTKHKIIIGVILGVFGIAFIVLASSTIDYSGEWNKLDIQRSEKQESIDSLQRVLDTIQREIDIIENQMRTLEKQAELARIKKGILPKAEAMHSAPQPAQSVDMDKLAYAIAMAETKNGELGYGKDYKNAFGIKNGSIAPCAQIGRNRMCIYSSIEASYEAFKKIWGKGYGGRYPTYRDAQVWTGNDRPDTWLKNVNFYYNQ